MPPHMICDPQFPSIHSGQQMFPIYYLERKTANYTNTFYNFLYVVTIC